MRLKYKDNIGQDIKHIQGVIFREIALNGDSIRAYAAF
jgi:hypothetical protein